jgi:hypothetical protein
VFPKRSDAILAARQLSNMERNRFVTDTEIRDMMNRHIASIYKDCITAFGASTYAQRLLISGLTSSGAAAIAIWPNTIKTGPPVIETTEFAMPANFERLLRCDWVRGTVTAVADAKGQYFTITQDNVAWTPMHPVDLQGDIWDTTPREWIEGRVRYWLKTYPGADSATEHAAADTTTVWWMAFLPPPVAVVNVHIFYIPKAPAYTDADATINIHLPNEAWNFVLHSAAADMIRKREGDDKALRTAALSARQEIITGDLSPDHANPMSTIDIGGNSSGRRRNVWGR